MKAVRTLFLPPIFPDLDLSSRASVSYPSPLHDGFSQDWMRNYFDSLALRRVGKRLLWGKRSLRKPDQGKESTEIWT